MFDKKQVFFAFYQTLSLESLLSADQVSCNYIGKKSTRHSFFKTTFCVNELDMLLKYARNKASPYVLWWFQPRYNIPSLYILKKKDNAKDDTFKDITSEVKSIVNPGGTDWQV